MLATLYYVRGKNALEYNENYANAYSQFVRALRYAPQHKLAKGKLAKGKRKKQEVLIAHFSILPFAIFFYFPQRLFHM